VWRLPLLATAIGLGYGTTLAFMWMANTYGTKGTWHGLALPLVQLAGWLPLAVAALILGFGCGSTASSLSKDAGAAPLGLRLTLGVTVLSTCFGITFLYLLIQTEAMFLTFGHYTGFAGNSTSCFAVSPFDVIWQLPELAKNAALAACGSLVGLTAAFHVPRVRNMLLLMSGVLLVTAFLMLHPNR
jgi:hypothetical protein